MSRASTKDLIQQIQKLWDKGHILAATLDQNDFYPKRLVFKTPSSKELSSHYDEVRTWIASLQNLTTIRIEMQSVRHPIIGTNDIPKSAWLDSHQNAVKILAKQQESQQFAEIVSMTRNSHPELLPWLKAKPLKALSLAKQWPQLLAVIDWLQANPNPGIYLRQADIISVDSKFIEQHRGVLSALLDLSLTAEQINSDMRGVGGFEARYGFKQKPLSIRFRLLDPEQPLLPGVDQDITLTRTDFCALVCDSHRLKQINNIFITENEINFLTFPNLPQSMILFGSGYGFEALSNISRLQELNVYYWGDIDTHGFAILDQLRAHLPHARSLLMDEATLMDHQLFWTTEPRQHTRDLKRLSNEENRLYNALVNNRIAKQLRLEQERVRYSRLHKLLNEKNQGVGQHDYNQAG